MEDTIFDIVLDKLKSVRGPISVTGYKFTPEQYIIIKDTVKTLNEDLEKWSDNLKNRIVNQISTHCMSA